MLNRINNCVEDLRVPYDAFYLPELNDVIDVRVDYVEWLTTSNGLSRGKLFFCNYPFLFDAQAKTSLLQIDQSYQVTSFSLTLVQRRLLIPAESSAHVEPKIGRDCKESCYLADGSVYTTKRGSHDKHSVYTCGETFRRDAVEYLEAPLTRKQTGNFVSFI